MSVHLKSITLRPEKYPTREHYPFTLPIFHQTKHLSLDSPVMFFVGENDTGKSTLLEAMAHACAGARIYSFDHVPVCPVAYEETEHYQIYKNFLMDRTKYL